jgi:hypothetical protein
VSAKWRKSGDPGGLGKVERGVLRPFVVSPEVDTRYAHDETMTSFKAGNVGGREWCWWTSYRNALRRSTPRVDEMD